MSTIFNKEAIQYDTYVTMETIICCKCAIPFGVPSHYRQHLRNTGETFYCPNGHSQVYSKPRIQSLEKQLKAKEKELAESKTRLWNIIDSKNETISTISRQKSAIKGQLTKVKKRIQQRKVRIISTLLAAVIFTSLTGRLSTGVCRQSCMDGGTLSGLAGIHTGSRPMRSGARYNAI